MKSDEYSQLFPAFVESTRLAVCSVIFTMFLASFHSRIPAMNVCLEQTLFTVNISELAQSSVGTVSKLNTNFNVNAAAL